MCIFGPLMHQVYSIAIYLLKAKSLRLEEAPLDRAARASILTSFDKGDLPRNDQNQGQRAFHKVYSCALLSQTDASTIVSPDLFYFEPSQ